MTDRSPGTYAVSAALHGAAVALVFLLAYMTSESPPPAPKIFELVAGAGDNYAATEAPALGIPGGVKLTVTAPPSPAPVPAQPEPPATVPPEPVAPPPAPVPPKPAPVTPAEKTAPVKPDTVPNFKKQVQATASRKAARIEAAYKKQLAAEQKRMTFEQYQKEHAAKAAAQAKGPRVDAEGIRAGVVGGSTSNKTGGAGGKALTRDQQGLLDSYFAMLRAKVHDAHVPPASASQSLEDPKVDFFLSAEGVISEVHITRSSGSPEYDQSVVDALSKIHMPARPDRIGDTKTLTFKIRDDDTP